MIERQRQATQRQCKSAGSLLVIASGASLEIGPSHVERENVDYQFVSFPGPVCPPRRKEEMRSRLRQQSPYGIRCFNVVVHKEPRLR